MSAQDRIKEFIAAGTEAKVPDLIASQEYDGGMGLEIAVLKRSDLVVLLMQVDDLRAENREVMREAREERLDLERQLMRHEDAL